MPENYDPRKAVLSDSSFDPRKAALNHAGRAHTEDRAESTSAVACGLVYVGDQLATANNHLGAIVGLLEQIDITIHNNLIDVAEAAEK